MYILGMKEDTMFVDNVTTRQLVLWDLTQGVILLLIGHNNVQHLPIYIIEFNLNLPAHFTAVQVSKFSATI